MKNSRILLAAAIVLIMGVQANAQWATNGDDIYNTNSGNVGIGTETPVSKLNVHNASGVSGLYLSSPYDMTGNRAIGYYRIENPTTGDLFNIVLRYRNGTHEMLQSAFDANTSTWREFIAFDYTTYKYEIRFGVGDVEYKNTGNVLINNTGGVGIGTSIIPTGSILAVKGKIACEEVEVTLSGWSDYVFAEGYKLRTLSEVESYINENKHLPDVPSEKEVLQNGVNIGEMNALLLTKIEELTLYMIEIKKENEEMKGQIEELLVR